MTIRTATGKDGKAIQKIHLAAFAKEENEPVARLAIDLLTENPTPPVLSLVSFTDDAITGHIAFSPLFIEKNKNWRGYILAPLAVAPEFQKQGVGRELIEEGIKRLVLLQTEMVFVYGDPGYYGRFDFTKELAADYLPPYELEYPFGWQALQIGKSSQPKLPAQLDCVASLKDPSMW